MILLQLTVRSLWHRRFTALLTLFTIAVSVMLLLGVERVRTETRNSFAHTLSDTDLVVGARSGQVQLLLYSIFRMGEATSNISWQSYQAISQHPEVAWTIPLSLGDSHKGYRVLGTDQSYFAHYRYGQRQPLAFSAGAPFAALYDVVLGSEVAAALGYRIGSELVVAHGMGSTSFAEHDDQPFRVVGILEATGTPVDRTLHLSLQALEAIHQGWQGGVRLPGTSSQSAALQAPESLQPKAVTAVLVGMKRKAATFHLQRMINNYRKEPLLAILPGVALAQLWDLVGVAEKALLLVSGLVVVAGLIGMLSVILAGLNERRRELAILRAVGARAWQILLLLTLESVLLTLLGVVLGVVLLYGAMLAAAPMLAAQFGIHLTLVPVSGYEWQLIAVVVGCGSVAGLVPGYRAYRYSLADGMTIKV